MKTMILAAVAAMSLSVGAAYAAGGPVGFADGSDYQGPASGTQALAEHRNEASVQFLGPNTVLGKMLHYSDRNQAAPSPASTKG
jgi:hypothetical protein